MAIAFNDTVLTGQPDPTLAEPALRCPQCEHPLASHDPVSLRYCRASGSTGSGRNCICASQF